ncbi:hypothetical protein [Arthrobacter antibioticus]|uniref:hypothetical protein n=1 Tax=Arthrobacter sp. H35-MC1 TaxID=3046203 RepID=UPI0024BAF39F|nr:hypothetical protein [Arthrobacter sp. H35-MC1]MDJ0316914.1 hypothetical protein [Arthrobacter sp. H35-MC1]
MDAQQPLSSLVPDPADIVGLVEQMVDGRWPRSEFDRKTLFLDLGFTSGASWEDAATATETQHYSLGLGQPREIMSSWTSHNGRFVGISMHLYSSMDTDNPSTRQGYEDFRRQFTALYGEPANPWHDPMVPACVWNVNGRRIAIRFFNLQHSSMMLSVEDAGLANAAEAAARRQNAPTNWNNSVAGASPFNLPGFGSETNKPRI